MITCTPQSNCSTAVIVSCTLIAAAIIGGALGFNYMQFVLTGMIVNTLYQMTIGGVVSLVEGRENDFTFAHAKQYR